MREAWSSQGSYDFPLEARITSTPDSPTELFSFYSRRSQSQFSQRHKNSFYNYYNKLNTEFQDKIFDFFDVIDTYCMCEMKEDY